MKITVFIVALFIVIQANAQNNDNYKPSKAYVSWGSGALTSGMDLSIQLDNTKHLVRVTGNAERAYLDYGFKWGNFSPEISFGYFKNIPWIGPKLIYTWKRITLFSWAGVGLSRNNQMTEFGTEPNFFFDYNAIMLSLPNNFTITYANMFFATGSINHLPAIKKTLNLREHHSIATEITYNTAEEIPMFVLFYSYKF